MAARQVPEPSRTIEKRSLPMSPWNRDALLSLRGDLKNSVNTHLELSMMLEIQEGGFMNRHEAQLVRELQGSSEQTGRLIDILCDKDDMDFSTFLQMLRRANYEAWAIKLKRKAEELKREEDVQLESRPADPDGKAETEAIESAAKRRAYPEEQTRLWKFIDGVFSQLRHDCPIFGILVIGETGTGKSTLINNLLGREVAVIGHTMESETQLVTPHELTVEGVPVVVYDTPGLDDTEGDDDEKHLEIMKSLLSRKKIHLVIYCMKLTETRMRRGLIRTFREYHKIGVPWEQTVVTITFADVIGDTTARFTQMQRHLKKILVEKAGVTSSVVDVLKICPTAKDPTAALPSGKQWYVPFWLDVVQVLVPAALVQFLHIHKDDIQIGEGTPVSRHPNSVNITLVGEDQKRFQREVDRLPELQATSGALAGVKDSDAVVEAVMQGDVDTAKKLLRVAESDPQKPPSWRFDYEEAVEKGGSVEVDINRCILIGPSGTGKSCFKHLLVHNKPKEVKISTPVMEKPDVVTISAEEYAVEGTSVWVSLTDEKMANSIRSSCQNREYDFDEEAVDMVPEDYQEEQVSKFTPPVEEIKPPTVAAKMASSSFRAKPSPLIPTQQSPFYKAHSHLMNDPTPGDAVLLNGGRFVHLLDTGGQPSFQTVLPLLLDVPCTSLFIFNASRGLDENVPVTYRPDEATVVEAESSCEKAWTMMLRSLSSVYNLAHKVSSNAQALLGAKRLPPFRAVVVGTFKDCLIEKGNIASATQEIAEHMQQLEKKPYYSQIIPDSEGQLFHLVTNFPRYEASGHTLENQASINGLREILSHPDGALNAKIPIGWYHFEMVCRKVDQKFFTFSDLLQHARELKCVTSADQFRSLLQLFHALGVFTFIDREDVSHMVCTHSSAFMQVVSKLLAVEFLTAPKRPAVKMFKKTGILSLDRGLFNELGISKEVDPEWLLRCLCHLGVAACLSPAGTDTPEYFIPAALPPESKAVECGSVVPLLVAFKFKANAFLTKEDFPHGIFARLAVELANNGWEVITEKNTRLSIQFRWKKLDISIIESAGFIRIVPIVSIHAKCNAVKLHERCSVVQSTFMAAIQASAQAVLGSKFTDKADTVSGFACPCKARPTHLAVPSGDSIVCTLSSECQEYSKSHQVWFSHVEGAQLQPHSSNPGVLCLDDPTSRGGGESATPFPVTEILKKHETEFFSVVDASLSLRTLKRLQVITQGTHQRCKK